MKTVGIICEYNPFHNGHQRQFQFLREKGYDCIICLMSGNFVQRGEPAIFPLCTRANAALSAGADLILELPYPYSTASADYFAQASISILSRLGVNTLSFGSECNNPSLLKQAAIVTLSPLFQNTLKELRIQFPQQGAAHLYQQAYYQCTGQNYPESPNDRLGVTYLRAAYANGLSLQSEILFRNGSGYAETSLSPCQNPSASAIRTALHSNQCSVTNLSEYLPSSVLQVFENAVKTGMGPVHPDSFFTKLIPYFRIVDPCNFTNIAELTSGLAHRICSTAQNVSTNSEWQDAIQTKKYTNAHIRRAILYAMTQVSPQDLASPPAYTRLLACNRIGRQFLASQKKDLIGFLVTKPTVIPNTESAKHQFRLSNQADALYTLALPTPQIAGYFLKQSPIIATD